MSENKDKKPKISVYNFDKHDNGPKLVFRKENNKDYINYGDNNLYPEFLLSNYINKSSIHKSIINMKVKMIAGGGFVKYDNPSLNYQLFFENKFGGDNLDIIAKKVSFDYEIYNGFATLVRWNKGGDKIASIKHIPFHKIRRDDDNNFYLSKDWTDKYQKKDDIKVLPGFNSSISKEQPSQIYYYIDEEPGSELYPVPYYSASIPAILISDGIKKFHLNSLNNGFFPSFLINFSDGEPTDEEMERAKKDLEKTFQGYENAGKWILSFSDGQDRAPVIDPIPLNDSDKRFQELNKTVRDELFIGHGVTNPQLFGIRVPGQLGGTKELLESLQIFQSTFINERQGTIENYFNKLKNINKVEEDFELNTYEIDFDVIENNE